MQTTAQRSRRTRPEYRGFVSDGYYLDSAGRLRFQPEPRGDIDLARARLDALLLDDLPTPPPRPAVVAVEVAGRWPRAKNVAAIRTAVDEIPSRFRSRWLAAGGRLEIVPGDNARIHPRSARLGPVLGWSTLGSVFCVVAGDHADSPLTASHEIGHALDYVFGYPSHSAEWLKIWQNAKAAGKVPAHGDQRQRPAEYFAESFARLWHPTLFITSQAAQDFIMGLV